jgi:hypothetical protein
LLKLSEIEVLKKSHVAALSPVQWIANLLDPKVELLVSIKGLTPFDLRY